MDISPGNNFSNPPSQYFKNGVCQLLRYSEAGKQPCNRALKQTKRYDFARHLIDVHKLVELEEKGMPKVFELLRRSIYSPELSTKIRINRLRVSWSQHRLCLYRTYQQCLQRLPKH